MSTQGDEFRGKASALRAAGPALAGLRDWYAYFKQPDIAAAYGTVYDRIDEDAALYDRLAEASDSGAVTKPTGYATGYDQGYT